MSCKLVLDSSPVVAPGGRINGRVQCRFSAPEDIKEIRCTLKGIESVGTYPGKDASHYNVFLNLKERLAPRGNQKIGRYEYTFTFVLPEDIPSSYQADIAEVEYILRAIVDVPFNTRDDKMSLCVTSKVDLNKILSELTLIPFTLESHNTAGCWCWQSTQIELNVTLEKDAFVLGETVNFKIFVKNDSTQNIDAIQVDLKKVLETKPNENVKKASRSTKEILLSKTLPGVAAHHEDTICANIIIPTNIELFSFIRCVLIREVFIIHVEAVNTPVYIEAKINLGDVGVVANAHHLPDGTGEGVRVSFSKHSERTHVRSRSSKDLVSPRSTFENLKHVPSIPENVKYPHTPQPEPHSVSFIGPPSAGHVTFNPVAQEQNMFTPYNQGYQN